MQVSKRHGFWWVVSVTPFAVHIRYGRKLREVLEG